MNLLHFMTLSYAIACMHEKSMLPRLLSARGQSQPNCPTAGPKFTLASACIGSRIGALNLAESQYEPDPPL
jgi:hypothetical protein